MTTRARRSLFVVGAAACLLAASAVATGQADKAQAAVVDSCPTVYGLVNGSFETPVDIGVQFLDQSTVPGWWTTDSTGTIEFWGTDTGIDPQDGAQVAEVNANEVATMYQDIATMPGMPMAWRVFHHGRGGVDQLSVQIGPPGGPLVEQALLTTGNYWAEYRGAYTVPAGQTTTRLALASVGGGGGAGNIIDGILLGNSPCVPATKSVFNLDRLSSDPYAIPGEIIQYQVDIQNQGGFPATDAVLTDALPAGVTYVPGSLYSSDTGMMTDAAGDDAAEYDAGTRTVRIRVGEGADGVSGGELPIGVTTTVTFQVTVDAGTTGQVIDNAAQVVFTDPTTSSSSTTDTLPASFEVQAEVDLNVTQSLDTTLANDAPVQYTITVANQGPDASTGTQLTTTLPMSGMTTSEPGCTISGTDLTCTLGSLASLGSRAIVVSGTIPATAPGGTTYTLTSAAGGDGYDTDPTDDSATRTDTLANAAAVTLSMSITNTATGTTGGRAHPGDRLRADYVVTNMGNVDLTTIAVTDPVFGPVTCSPATIAPRATASCTGSTLYTVTPADVTVGSVTSTASVSASAPAMNSVVANSGSAAMAVAAAGSGGAALALTGASPMGALGLAAALLAIGAVGLLVTRRRAA